jgi:hypothetical protein
MHVSRTSDTREGEATNVAAGISTTLADCQPNVWMTTGTQMTALYLRPRTIRLRFRRHTRFKVAWHVVPNPVKDRT